MSQNGKGDRQRPRAIPLKQWYRNYDSIDWNDSQPKPESSRQEEEQRPARPRTR